MEMRTQLASVAPAVRVASPTAHGGAPSREDELVSLLDGFWVENQEGRCFVARQVYDATYVHGHDPLQSFLGIEVGNLSELCRDPAVARADLASSLFLDTETTGLDRTSGTLVFIVGVGYFQLGQFHILQFFLHDSSSERAMLHLLCELLRESTLLLTFNGKSFDVPMLDSRYARCRMDSDLAAMPHADMLHPARRLWKHRLQSVRLTALERHILGLRRTGDVPGYLIPQMYLRYQDSGGLRSLLPVFYHNAQDVLTLLALTTHAASVFADPWGGRVESGIDFLSVGKAYEASGRERLAIRAYDSALSRPLPPAVRTELCGRLTSLYKRQTPSAGHIQFWEEMVARPGTQGIHAFEELAKHYEHEEQRYDRAEELVRTALRMLPHDPCARTSQRDLEKRLRRIQQKRASVSS